MTRARIFALIAAAAATTAALVVACSDSPTAPDAHDTVIDDTKPMPVPTTHPDPDGGVFPVPVDASPYEAGSYGDKPDGYAPLALCDMCMCAGGDGKYCFGGGDGKTFGGTCDVDGGTTELMVGCNAIPAACTGKSSLEMCPCILQQLPMMSCFPVCEVTSGGFAVYCPNP